ncbi:response regulator [Glycomyces harbinensis]|uniref:DNA-binding response regulator, NarL/FixJ family, contains REC and HTH domains n=1 Tax=Glycomyces harbinensis TaxID=58114 RepID=A0A1G6RI73_9ACTN|nr:response regulator transcription factor [Glycomyces harbinensis]SDD03616.1 DNA-binding response regulator, NarL/FixJ family, contains REC and HTH domains [Glycomyces harbinensis]
MAEPLPELPTPDRDGPVRVLLADDDRLVRAGIAGILATADGIEVTAEAGDGAEALDLARGRLLDVILLDVQMPRLDGIRTLERLQQTGTGTPVAMLTTFSDEHYIAEAIRLGALGFFLKSDDPHHLIAGVRALAGGGAAFSPRVGRWLIRRQSRTRVDRSLRAQALVQGLTTRQREVLAGVGQGLSNAQIAASLQLAEGTVKQYLSSLFTALGTENRVQAALIAYEAGLGPDR